MERGGAVIEDIHSCEQLQLNFVDFKFAEREKT